MSASEELYHGDLGAIYDQVLTVEWKWLMDCGFFETIFQNCDKWVDFSGIETVVSMFLEVLTWPIFWDRQ